MFRAPMSALQGLRRLGSSVVMRHRVLIRLLGALVVVLPLVALLFGASLLAAGAFLVALAIVGAVAWRAGETRSGAVRSLLETLEEGVVMVDRRGALLASNPS